jgi:hypothetical protein
MGQSDISFADVCKEYGFDPEEGLEIFKKEFNRRVDGKYGNFIMTLFIDEAFVDQKRRGVIPNKNHALIPILPRICKYAECYPKNNNKINPLTKKPSKGYIPMSKVGEKGLSAQLEFNKILEEKFKSGTFRSNHYQDIIKTLLKKYDRVKAKEKYFDTWKKDFLTVVKTFKVDFGTAYTFEELEKLAKKKRLKTILKAIK